ncbi:MAG: hypothetical protein KatS3mg058_1959 [Roseiflexus sp.]|jgi:hypothetical protein|nr:MAG: hypothetical protein KatS3mg058_1959 [Roseiflexus sp.]
MLCVSAGVAVAKGRGTASPPGFLEFTLSEAKGSEGQPRCRVE